jgi:protease-4
VYLKGTQVNEENGESIPIAHPVKVKRINMTVVVVTFAILATALLIAMGFFRLVEKVTGSAFELDVTSPEIGVVEVSGVIVSSEDIMKALAYFEDIDSIRAIVMRIDSPGGQVGACQEVYEEIIRLRKEKNIEVYASIASVGASGGYYIAAATNQIFAQPGTLTGSIGAIVELVNIRSLYEWIKIKKTTVKSAEYKDMGSPLKEMTAAESELFNSLVKNIHMQFVADIAAARHMPLETVSKLADGRVYTGKQALELGLIDQFGNLHRAIAYASEKAGLGKDPKVTRFRNRQDRLMDVLMDSEALVPFLERQFSRFMAQKADSLRVY